MSALGCVRGSLSEKFSIDFPVLACMLTNYII
nr:MAG TPA: hypothetical protein [Caudoviricetes sp.]